MTSQQLAILNSLVTYAAENVPGGLSPEEQEVARIVGAAALLGGMEAPEKPKEVSAPDPHRWQVVFAGKSETDEKIVIYKDIRSGWILALRKDDGEVWALDPDSEVTRWNDAFTTYVQVSSKVWTGKAFGTSADLLSAIEEQSE
jgi:hypothetical protein